MKINWQFPTIKPDAPLSETDVANLQERVRRHSTSPCNVFSMSATPKEVKWLQANLENACVKTTDDGVNDDNAREGFCLVFIGVNEYTVDQARNDI